MIKVLLADDELVVRIGIKSMIDWNANGFEIVGEAVDGLDALDKIEKYNPHVLLTDIKMPRMDGIELIKNVKEKYKKIQIIVLSCHNDFEYVKDAMKLGASDYILKLSMRVDDLLNVMNSLKLNIEEDSQKLNEVNDLARKINSNMDVIKGKFFKKVLNGSYPTLESIFNEARDYNLKFCEGFYTIAVLNINRCLNAEKRTKLEPDLLRYSIINVIEEMMTKQLLGDVFAETDESFIIIFTEKNSGNNDSQGFIRKIQHFLNEVKDSLKIYLGVSATCGVCSSTLFSIENIEKAYREAISACEHRLYFNESNIIFYNQLNYNGNGYDYYNINDQKRIYNYLEVGEIEFARKYINNLFERLIEVKNIAPIEVKRICRQIFNTIIKAAENLKRTEAGSPPSFLDKNESIIDDMDCIYSLQEWFNQCLYEYIIHYNNILKGVFTEGIIKLKQHIELNYSQDVSLEAAASFLNIGKNYFCSVFKKETGMTFYDYFTNVRIDKAKELLRNTNLRTYEIAEKVGYYNINYFSTVFKKNVGLSPSEFRKA